MFITDTSTGTPHTQIRIVDRGNIIGHHYFIRGYGMAGMTATSRFWNILQSQTLTESEREFREQKEAFQRIPPLLLEEYRGRYVISHDGSILDADEDLDTLTSRFFAEHGDMPVFLTKVGGEVREFIDTPFFD